jgi:putative oxidoreductase
MLKDIGLLIARVGVGLTFVFVHGYPKLMGGPELWKRLGGAMGNLGITWFPELWGLLAMSAEFFGGMFLVLGLFSRPVAAIMCFDMIVAMLSHFVRLDPWVSVSHAMKMVFVFAALAFLGAGRFSLDRIIFTRKGLKHQEHKEHEDLPTVSPGGG